MLRRSAIAVLSAFPLAEAQSGYRAELQKWRANRERELQADGGWLTLTGLVWLHDGQVYTQEGAGTFERRGTRVLVRQAGGEKELPANSKASVKSGSVTVRVIERGGRYGLRISDNASPARREFKGLRWFPIDESYCITARFETYPSPKRIAVPNVLGDTLALRSPGYAEFVLEGKGLRLEPVLDEGGLMFIFRDRTSGRETYGGGRFLYTSAPKDGSVVLDFNKAENPPCAFTPYATCPLPPRQNRLPLRIAAGEMKA